MTVPPNGSGASRRPLGSWLRRVAALLVVAAVLTAPGCVVDGRPVLEGSSTASPTDLPTAVELGLPEQSLLAMPMRRQPVRGWTVSAADLGLETEARIRFSRIGNVGDRATFLAISSWEWWVVGIELSNGDSLFEPVWLGRHGSPEALLASECYTNGPTMIVCLRDEAQGEFAAHAWVIDTATGQVLHDGPTDLRRSAHENQPVVDQVGDYLVATVKDRGVYGIGPRAELTWRVPGTGSLPPHRQDDRDVPAPVVAVQSRHREPDVVFSLADGRVLNPTVPTGEEVHRATAYPGGFAYELQRDYFAGAGIAFFDNEGRERGRLDDEAHLLTGSDVMPLAQTASDDRVLTITGKPLLELPKSVLMPYTRLAGTTLLVSTDEERRLWRQFDLRTGSEGPTCDREELWYAYTATSGDVVIVRTDESPAQALDLATCETLWTMPGSTTTEAKEVWRVNTTLVLRVNDKLSSLVAPS